MSIDQRRTERHFHDDFDPPYHLYDPAAQPQMPRPVGVAPAKPLTSPVHKPMIGPPRPVRRPILRRGGR